MIYRRLFVAVVLIIARSKAFVNRKMQNIFEHGKGVKYNGLAVGLFGRCRVGVNVKFSHYNTLTAVVMVFPAVNRRPEPEVASSPTPHPKIQSNRDISAIKAYRTVLQHR